MNVKGIQSVSRLGASVRKAIPLSNECDTDRVEKDIKSADLRIGYFTDDRFRSYLWWDKWHNEPMIAINAKLPENFRKCSVIHELGHLLIKYNWVPFSDMNLTSRNPLNVERLKSYCSFRDTELRHLVDVFTASFLIPDDEVSPFVHRERAGEVALVNTIAREFQVTERIAKVRLDVFANDHGPSQEERK